jgi:hypothetical protein
MIDYKPEHGIAIPGSSISEYGKLTGALVNLEIDESVALARGDKAQCQLKQKMMGAAWDKAMKSRGLERKMTTRIYQEDSGEWVLRLWRTK